MNKYEFSCVVSGLLLLTEITAQAVFIPANGSNNVSRSANIVVQFSTTMNTNSFNTNKFIYYSRLNGFRFGAVSASGRFLRHPTKPSSIPPTISGLASALWPN